MSFSIKVQYIYTIHELYTDNRYKVDDGWDGFKKVVQNLPEINHYGHIVPSVLSLKRSVKVNYADDYDAQQRIDAEGTIMKVPLKEWVKIAGFNDNQEWFKYHIVVASGGKIPTIESLKPACSRKCDKCQYQDCRNSDKNAPAYYSNYVRVGIEPLSERHICVAQNDCGHLWPKPHDVTPANVSQELRDFFNQPDNIDIYTQYQDGILNLRIRSCAIQER
ncbi:MAG: hypothetical protein J6T57_01065 [Alphaproteobacteria bacterium]|nr:hypothetical protein [Alphaproteobacteria bacterium]